MPNKTSRRGFAALALCSFAAFSVACATPAELRKLQYRLHALEKDRAETGDGPRIRLADLGAQVTALQRTVDGLNGRLEVMERQVEIAVEEARAARDEAYKAAAPSGEASAGDGEPQAGVSEEVQQYRAAYAKWRAGDTDACIAMFDDFAAAYPDSKFADDAKYWIGDCHFKRGTYPHAVLRLDDVVREYPEGDKAPDALYRMGEALLRMGKSEAAGNAFQNLIRDYPNSARAPEAKKQLEILRAG